MSDLKGKKIAILTANEGVEKVEYTEPRKALEDAGATVEHIATEKGEVQLFEHLDKADTVKADKATSDVSADDYDALMLPGGVANPDNLRTDSDAVKFVQGFVNAGKPIAAICHAPWTLIEADAVKGRTLTSWPSLQTDLKNAGANWVDQEVVTDNGLVTSRKPDDIPAFNRKMIEEFAEGRHDRNKSDRMAGTTR